MWISPTFRYGGTCWGFFNDPRYSRFGCPLVFLVASKDYDETQIQKNHHVSLITAQNEFVMRCNFYISLSRNRAATLSFCPHSLNLNLFLAIF